MNATATPSLIFTGQNLPRHESGDGGTVALEAGSESEQEGVGPSDAAHRAEAARVIEPARGTVPVLDAQAHRRVPRLAECRDWDDAAVASRLGLTTVAQSMREQGAACARAALGQEPQSLVASWSLIRRASTHP
jgi:hypothetical protein